eukprot:2064412-Rhodomonas_salina.1
MTNSDCATNTPKTTEQVREALPAKHPIRVKEHGSTIPFKEVLLDFLQQLVNDMSLAHYGCEGPQLDQGQDGVDVRVGLGDRGVSVGPPRAGRVAGAGDVLHGDGGAG